MVGELFFLDFICFIRLRVWLFCRYFTSVSYTHLDVYKRQAADYELRFRKGLAPKGDWQSAISHFYAQKSIPVIKKTKKGEKELDIRPLIYRCV